jgi:hypothetical protein
MALFPDYCSAAELKAHLRITDTDDDTALGIAITAASRAIDHSCNRQFGVSTAVARVYRWDGQRVDGLPAVQIDDLSATTSLAVALDLDQDGTWEQSLTYQTDFDLYPWNASEDNVPWTHIVFSRTAAALPAGLSRELSVTGLFGWASVPTVVKDACLIQASRFFVRRDSPYGVTGSPEAGSELRLLDRLDPDVAVLLAPVRRWWGAVGGC